MRRVLITGSNRGIGLALVRESLALDDRVFATCRSPKDADTLQSLRNEHSQQLSVIGLDVLDSETHTAALREVEKNVGALDVLINNAGIYMTSPSVSPEESHHSVDSFDAASTLEMFRTNTTAPMAVTRVFLPLLARGDQARVGFLSSGMGSIGGKDDREIEYSYSASKAALNMMVRVLAHEVAGRGILAVALDPGWVATDMGTPQAPLQPDVVARGLWKVLGNLDSSRTGFFLDWKGNRVAW